MSLSTSRNMSPLYLALLVFIAAVVPLFGQQESGSLRPMTFMDVQEIRRGSSPVPSPDGRWALYSVTVPDWEKARSQSDIHLVSLRDGVTSNRQMTFTGEKNERSPQWSRDSSFFVFLSDRDAEKDSQNQLYLMRPDGGEARRITDAKGGVTNSAFSPDGKWLVYRAGESGQQQLWRLPVEEIITATPETLTTAEAGVNTWKWSPDSRSIYLIRPVRFDEDEKKRQEKKFTVDVKNRETPISNLWILDLSGESVQARQLTKDPAVDVSGFNISDDGRWIAFSGGSAKRYERNITGARLYADQFLIETGTGHIERLTTNYEVGESTPMFSPDSRWIVFGGPDDMTRYTMTETRAYIREVADRGGSFRKLGSSFDGSVRGGFFSEDGSTIYFNAGVKVTAQLHALDVKSGAVRQITKERASVSVNRDQDTGTLLISYSNPKTPPTYFTIGSIHEITNRSAWIRLMDVNPQVRGFALGEEIEINWTSTDGKTVGGVLFKPVGYREGEHYPLVVSIHGGPASADVLRFNAGSQVYAGAGYAVLKPNYRGSRNYGNAHRTDIVGDYFTLGFDDIMTGVDYLIAEGIVDGDRMGAFGWSAGGHWSNWILTHTDRFKAISSGAGTMNWISMYAQSDVQRNRRFYIGDDFLYENFEPYWNQSPLKYVANAKTPTMIHVVEGDPRVPSPQSVELHMALKKLGVDTELFMYPGRSHGIPDPRNRLVKAVSEMKWMDYYVRGIGEKFSWHDVLKTLKK